MYGFFSNYSSSLELINHSLTLWLSWVHLRFYYRPQRSCSKVMFLYLSVCSREGEGVSQHALGQASPLGRHIPACTGAYMGRHIPACTWADTRPWQTYPSMHWGRHPLPPTTTAADGTHPTGMHSCLEIFSWIALCMTVRMLHRLKKFRLHRTREPRLLHHQWHRNVRT